MIDYEQKFKESNEETMRREKEDARRAAAEGGAPYEGEAPREDLRDSTRAINPETGKIGEENAPSDPNLNREEPSTSTSAQPASNTETRESEKDSMAVASVSENEGKKTSFLDPDLEKGLWDTLDKKVKEALSGNTPEDLGINMAFAFLTFLCEVVSNYANHIRKERKRLDKEYKERTAEWDKNMGVTPTHKSLAIWATIADHPAMRQFANKPISSEMVRAAYDLYCTDKTVQKNALRIISAMTGRELTKDESNTYFKNAFKTKFGNTTLASIKGMALNNEKFLEGVQIAGLQKEILSAHQQTRGHQEAVQQNQSDRSTLNTAQNQTQQAPDYSHTNAGGRGI